MFLPKPFIYLFGPEFWFSQFFKIAFNLTKVKCPDIYLFFFPHPAKIINPLPCKGGIIVGANGAELIKNSALGGGLGRGWFFVFPVAFAWLIIAPLQGLENTFASFPRALPRAVIWRPFRA